MDLTIIIVNWNGGEMLFRCLESIRASRTSFAVKVIVVDNDSSDGSREEAQRRFPEFHIFNSGANLGFGRANNLARPIVHTPLVLFLNPDTELRVDTLEISVKCLLQQPDVGALSCKMLYPNGVVQEQSVQWHLNPWRAFLELALVTRVLGRCRKNWPPTADPCLSAIVCKLCGGYVLAHKSVLDEAGWFDERYFMYAEDADLSRTIQSHGWKLYHCSEAEVIHHCGGTSKKAPGAFSTLMQQESISKLMRKYYGWTGATFYRGAVLAAASLRLLLLALARVIANSDSVRASFVRHKFLLLWALGLRSAQIPKRREPAASVPLSQPVSSLS